MYTISDIISACHAREVKSECLLSSVDRSDACADICSMDIRHRLGQNLKRLRTAKGLSQEQFAFEANIHRTYISDIERGARNPTITVVDRIAEALGAKVGELLD